MAELGKLTYEVSASTAKFDTAMKSVAKDLKDVGKKFSDVGKSISKIAIGGIATAGAGLFALAQTTANAGDEIQKMAIKTGFSTETLSELKHAAELGGATIQTVEKATKRMASTIFDAGQGMATAEDALTALNLSYEDLANLSPEEQFEKLSTALANVEDATTRSAIAQDIFGRAGTDLLPMFAEGAEGMAAMRDEARQLGLVFSQESADASAKFNDDLLRLKGAFAGLFREIGMKIIPIIVDELIPAIKDHVIPTFKNFAEKINSVVSWFTALDGQGKKQVVMWVAIVAAIGPVLVIIGKVISVIGTLMGAFKALSATAAIMKVSVGALVVSKAILFAKVIAVIAIITALVASIKWLWENNETFRNVIITIWTGIKEMFVAFWEVVTTLFEVSMNFVKELVETTMNWLGEFWDKWGSSITEITEHVFNAIFGIIKTQLDIITGIFRVFIKLLKGDWSGAWNEMKNTLSQAWNNIKTVISNAFSAIKKAMSTAFGGIIRSARNWGRNMIQGFVDGIVSQARAAQRAAKRVIDGIKDFIGFNSPTKKGEGRFVVDWGENMMKGFLDGVENMKGKVESTVSANVNMPKMAMASGNSQTANIIVQLDGRVLAKAIGQPLVNEIRIRTGVKI